MRFHARFVGAFALEDAQGQNVLPPLRKTRALVAMILLAGGEALSRGDLIQFAWKDRDDEQGRASLRQALYEARRLTQGEPPLIYANRTMVRANLAVLESDLDRLNAAARGVDLEALDAALGPNASPLLADLDGISPTIDAWLAAIRREKLAELREVVNAAAGDGHGGGRFGQGPGREGGPAPADRASEAADVAPTPRPLNRTRLLAGAALLLLCAGVAGAWWLRAAPPHRVLAVEPLNAGQGDGPAQAVSRGLSGDLAHALVANPARIVVNQIGEPGVRAADADFIVSGDVATLGGRLQAHVQLARARSGAILWANDFAADPGHPDVMREQIATKADAVINCALSARHGGAARISDEADRLYLKACDLVEQYRLDEALQPFREVTVLEPGFARAWADLAITEALTADPSDPKRQAIAYREASAHARHALALDPRTGLAYYALAQGMPGIANWRRRVEIIADGLKVEPDGSELNNAMATELMRVGRSAEGIAYYRRSMAADPLNPVKTATLFHALAFHDQLDEAEPMIDRALRLWPQSAVIWQYAFVVELRVGDPRRAEAMLADPDHTLVRDDKEADEYRQFLRLRRDPSPKNIAAAIGRELALSSADPDQDQLPAALRIARLGRTDLAYRLALQPRGAMDEDNDEVMFRAGLTPFQDDPRFMVLAARRGLLPIWRATGVWPDVCATDHPRGCGQAGSGGQIASFSGKARR